jgi:hypothetical protein
VVCLELTRTSPLPQPGCITGERRKKGNESRSAEEALPSSVLSIAKAPPRGLRTCMQAMRQRCKTSVTLWDPLQVPCCMPDLRCN